MRNEMTLMIRYLSANHSRFVIQRGDDRLWTGDGWSKILDCAQVFRDHKDAQAVARAIQRRRFRGQPVRRFRVDVTLTLTGNDVGHVNQDMLVKYLADAVRIDIATSEHGDGPVEDVYLEATMKVATLREEPVAG